LLTDGVPKESQHECGKQGRDESSVAGRGPQQPWSSGRHSQTNTETEDLFWEECCVTSNGNCQSWRQTLQLAWRLFERQRTDSNKVYSVHAPQAE
jgi:hypothetical protein